MRKSIVYEIRTMVNKREFCFSFIVVLVFSLFSYVMAAREVWGGEWSQVLSADAQFMCNDYSATWYLFSYVFSFVIVIPHSMSYIGDIESGAYSLAVVRAGKFRYFISKIIAVFLGNFLIIALPFLINLLLCHLTFSDKLNYWFGAYGLPNYFRTLLGTNFFIKLEQKQIPFILVFLKSPTLYNLLYTGIISVASGVLGVSVLCLSFIVRKRAFLFLPVYLIFLLSSTVSNRNYSVAAASPETVVFQNYNLMDYLTAFGYPGQDYRYVFTLLLAIIIFCVLATCWAIKRDQLISGKYNEK